MKTLLWLDDIRDPIEEMWNNYIAKNIGNPLNMNIFWVKKYHDFKTFIKVYGMPDIISFDHDLENFHISKSTFIEYTGMDCAKWIVEHCMDTKQKLPEYHVHSSNPVGAENIKSYLMNYEKNEQTDRHDRTI